jgi:succinyl-CoA synthetase alpha subunit
MGHAGAIITGASGRAQDKMDALAAVGVTVTKSPAEIGSTIQKVLASKQGKKNR